MQDVIFKVKADLGPEAVIVNKRKSKKGGIFGFFGKEVFEVVAALESKAAVSEPKADEENTDDIVQISNYGRKSKKIERTEIPKTASKDPENKNAIKEFIDDLKTASESEAEKEIETKGRKELEKQKADKKPSSEQDSFAGELQKQQNLSAAQKLQNKFDKKNTGNKNKNLNNSNQLYNYLLDQGVDSRNVNLFLKEMDIKTSAKNEKKFENRLKEFLKIYFTDNQEIKLNSEQKIVTFIGPTGVGKTTTMAKIAAHFAVDKNKNVGLITADTYRIAAVEQLQTYSEIIDIPFAVCYSSSKLEEMIAGQFRNCDLVLIDTPGSSWKDQTQLGRLKDYVDHSLVDEVHLLLSLNTKSSDLRSIVSKFSELDPDRALLTKLDETSSYGDIINIKANYDLPLSYLTCGQDVPEDIETANPEKIYSYLFGDFNA